MLEFLLLVMLDGRTAHVNPSEIVSIIDAKDADDPSNHFVPPVRCVISMTDGKMLTTATSCEDVEKQLRQIADERIKEMRK